MIWTKRMVSSVYSSPTPSKSKKSSHIIESSEQEDQQDEHQTRPLEAGFKLLIQNFQSLLPYLDLLHL